MNEQFARDVLKGLSARHKYLSSKYFYDEQGDALFQRIMDLPEYYLTRSEYQIFETHRQEMLNAFEGTGGSFDLIEFGAGDGLKTKVLLQHFLEAKTDFTYMPIDISQNALDILQKDLNANMPELDVQPLQGEYFQALSQLPAENGRKKVVLFLGSNIGNFLHDIAVDFLSKLSQILNTGDHLLMGVDLKKDPQAVSAAYNDAQGVTRAFNLNLLERINREFTADFNLDKFMHYPTYNPMNGEARSFLVSVEPQTVNLGKLNASFHFDAWETISMELSQKYDLHMLQDLALNSGFKMVNHFYDSRKFFTDTLFEVT